MPTSYTGKSGPQDPEEERAALAARGAPTQGAPQVQQNYQKTFQPPAAQQVMPGQQTPMPWGGQAPQLAQQGQGATPWGQNTAPAAGAPGAPGGQSPVNWQALQQQFGGGAPPALAQGPSPGQDLASARRQAPVPIQSPAAAPPSMQPPQGQQGGQWLQNMLQQAAARISGGGRGDQARAQAGAGADYASQNPRFMQMQRGTQQGLIDPRQKTGFLGPGERR